MGMLDQLTPAQKKLLGYGAAGVVGAVAVGKLSGGGSVGSSETAPPAPTVTPIQPMPSTDAIGVGELGDYFSNFTDAISELMERVDDLEQAPPTSAEPPPDPSAPGPVQPPSYAPAPEVTDEQRMQQQVRDLFARYNVPTSYTYKPTGESPEARVERLAREQLAGTRSWEELQKSVKLLGDVKAGKKPVPK